MRTGAAPQSLDQGNYIAKNSFIYALLIASLAPGASTTVSFNIDGDSDFFWGKFAAWSLVAADGTVASTVNDTGCTIIVTNTTSGRQYMNSPVPLNSMAGTAQLPFILPMQTYWPAKTTLQVQLANVTDNTTYAPIYLSFIGIKAFAG